MEPHIRLGEEKKVCLHGVWVAGLRISDRLVQSIATEYSDKPSRPCTLSLTSRGLDLQVLSPVSSFPSHPEDAPEAGDASGGVRPGKSQHISLNALRDCSMNRYDQYCLLVVFVDSKNVFSILVLSSSNPSNLWEVPRVFKELRNQRVSVSSPPPSPSGPVDTSANPGNWILRPTDSKDVVDAGTRIVSVQTTDYSIESATPPEANGVALSAPVQRLQHDGKFIVETYSVPDTSDVPIQVNEAELLSSTEAFRRISSSSNGSQDEATLDRLEDISTEEFHNRRNRLRATQEGTSGGDAESKHDANGSQDMDSSLTAPLSNGEGHNHDNETHVTNLSIVSTFALRSVGQQTEPVISGPQRTRYTKKPLNASLSHQYKEKVAAVRKKGSSGAGNNVTPTTTSTLSQNGAVGAAVAKPVINVMNSPSGQMEMRTARPLRSGPLPRPKSSPDPATIYRPVGKSISTAPVLITSGSTISRPIETVYMPRVQIVNQPVTNQKERSAQQQQHRNEQNLHPQQQQQQHQQHSVMHVQNPSQRVVILPRKQPVGPPPRVYSNNFHSVPSRRTYSSATAAAVLEGRLRKISTSNSYSGATIIANNGGSRSGGSRSNSLRARGGLLQHLQQNGRPVTHHPPPSPTPKQIPHLL